MQKVQCKLVFIVTCLKLPLTTKLVSNAENEVDLYGRDSSKLFSAFDSSI